MERIYKSTTVRVALRAYLSTDHATPATGKTIAVTISKNGAAFGNPNAGATNATEISNGWYYVDLDATDTGTLGPLLIRGTATGVDDVAKDLFVESQLAIKKNMAVSGFAFVMKDTTGQPVTGKMVTAKRVLDGGSLTTMANSVTEISGGTYTIDLAAADVNGTTVLFLFTASGCLPTEFNIITQP